MNDAALCPACQKPLNREDTCRIVGGHVLHAQCLDGVHDRLDELPLPRMDGLHVIIYNSGTRFRLMDDTNIDGIVVPEGFVTDFASTPKWCWMIYPPTGHYQRAALLHDYLYGMTGHGPWGSLSRGICDLIFREQMKASPRASPRAEAPAKARCAEGAASPKAAAAAAAAAASAAAALAACADTSSEWMATLAEVSKAVVVLKARARARAAPRRACLR